ncbi:MAG: hypothetical protein IKO40_12725 [Kiritimatiellae bacterium]|nr:hypothetical protein [Kiritimatiellia bacterium]
MSVVKEDWDLDENGKRFSWRFEYSSKNGLLTKEMDTIGSEYKHIAYYQYDSRRRLRHRFTYAFDMSSFPLVQGIQQQKTGEDSPQNVRIDYETCFCYLENRIIVGDASIYYSRNWNMVKVSPYTLYIMSPYYIENNWYLKRPDYLTKMIKSYEEEVKKQEQNNQLYPKAKLAHRVRLSPELYPDMSPRIPFKFLNEVREIYEAMSRRI